MVAGRDRRARPLDVVVNNVGGNGLMVPFPQLRFAGWTR